MVSRFDDDLGGDGTDQPEHEQSSQLPRPTSFQSPITKVNPLRHGSLTPSPNPAVVDRAFSLSSMELEIDRMEPGGKARQAEKDADESLNDSESWTPDTKERRSPEGGEDVGSNVSVACLKSSGSGKKVGRFFNSQIIFQLNKSTRTTSEQR